MFRRLLDIRLLALLCLVALCSAQVFGVARGYLCACSGEQLWTSIDHCHGPHNEDCHSELAAQPHDENEQPGEREEHDQLRDEVQLVQASSVGAPAMMPVVLAVLPDVSLVISPAVVAGAASQREFVEGGPPPSVAIARTVVLLI